MKRYKTTEDKPETIKHPLTVAAAVALLVVGTSLLDGCQDRFRYPCQDPKNWEIKECKPPICTVTQTCPEMLVSKEAMGK